MYLNKKIVIKKVIGESKLDQIYESGAKNFLKILDGEMNKRNNPKPYILKNKKKNNKYLESIDIYSSRLYYCLEMIKLLDFIKIKHKKIKKKYNEYDQLIYDNKRLYEWLQTNYYILYNLIVSNEFIL